MACRTWSSKCIPELPPLSCARFLVPGVRGGRLGNGLRPDHVEPRPRDERRASPLIGSTDWPAGIRAAECQVLGCVADVK